MPKRAKVGKGHSSSILYDLFGDFSLYSRVMEREGKRLARKYPDKNLSRLFNEMPHRMITVLPMALFHSMSKDLGNTVSKEAICAIGLCSFPIGTHDDIVDETPDRQQEIAALVYAGNIAASEGLMMLMRKGKVETAEALVESINRNHFRQQRVVDLLWSGRKPTEAVYLDGIRHIVEFISIGPLCAIAEAEEKGLRRRIMDFSEGYGPVIQLIDDIREVDEDRRTKYASLPLTEGKPFRSSFRLGFEGIAKARRSLKPEWNNMAYFVDRAEQFLMRLEAELSG